MATGQGTTWVLVADAQHARLLDVEDAGMLPRQRSMVKAPTPDAQHRSPQHGWTHGEDPRPEHEERRFVHALVQTLERGAADNHFRHLVLVAPPKLLGLLRDSLSRGLADRLRKSISKDWGHVPDAELPQYVRSLVEIWPH